jgi:hypothetical protein
LLAVSNQGNSAFNANLQIFLPKFESKIFWGIETLGKSKKRCGFLFLREEVREEP